MRVDKRNYLRRYQQFWCRMNWLAFIVWVVLQAISFTIHLDLGVAVNVFPIVQAVLAIVLIFFAMSAILYRSPAFCKLYVGGSVFFSCFLLGYLIWKITRGTKLLEEDQRDRNPAEIIAFYVINFLLVVTTIANCISMHKLSSVIDELSEDENESSQALTYDSYRV